MKNKTTKKATNKKSKKMEVVKVEHNGVVTYKAAPKKSHMSKKGKIILVSVLCGILLLIALVGMIFLLVKPKK